MRIGIDVGYNAVKAVYSEKMVSFLSIVGSPDESRFSLNGTGDDNSVIEVDGQSYLVGTEALTQSRFATRKQDRGWINSQEYKILFLTALAQITKSSRVNMDIVTGLPVNFYDDKDMLRENLLGEHKIKYNDHSSQIFTIRNLRVIPQPFGTAFSIALNDKGEAFESNPYVSGNIGIIDIGGFTVNLLTIKRLHEIGTKTESVNSGAWKAILAIKKTLMSQYPDLGDMHDHEVAEMVQLGTFDYYSETIDISGIARTELSKLSNEIRTVSANLWGKAPRLKILITGGGALLMGDSIKAEFPHAEIVKNPVLANAIGYWKFAQRF